MQLTFAERGIGVRLRLPTREWLNNQVSGGHSSCSFLMSNTSQSVSQIGRDAMAWSAQCRQSSNWLLSSCDNHALTDGYIVSPALSNSEPLFGLACTWPTIEAVTSSFSCCLIFIFLFTVKYNLRVVTHISADFRNLYDLFIPVTFFFEELKTWQFFGNVETKR